MFSFFILFFLIFFYIKSIKIQMTSNVENFILNVYIDGNEYIPMILNTGIEKSLIAAENCSICNGERFKPSKSSQFLNENVTQNVSHFVYRGNEYLQEFYFDSNEYYKLKLDYINFYDIKYKKETTIEGIFSLNFVNFNIASEKKIFAIEYTNEGAFLEIGEINKEIVKDYSKLINYTVSINENKDWFLEANKLIINNEKMPIENPKIILDTFSYFFIFQKNFFLIILIKFSLKKADVKFKCQVHLFVNVMKIIKIIFQISFLNLMMEINYLLILLIIFHMIVLLLEQIVLFILLLIIIMIILLREIMFLIIIIQFLM